MAKVGMMCLGCPKNQVDAEILLNIIAKGGHTLVDDVAHSDVAIVNTCGFIESAKQESIDEIMELGRLKADGTIKKIIVTGCLAERYSDSILDDLPEVDAVVGIGKNSEILDIINETEQGERRSYIGEKTDLPIEGDRVRTTPYYFTYLKIAEGCDNRCSYCAIPYIRGGFRSRSMESIVEEAKSHAADGVKELVVVAQDTTRYGEDLYGRLALPELLHKLCEIDGIEWIRLLYCYPDRITDELLQTIANEDKIVKYMDIPLQHCNGQILKAMNRRGDCNSLTALIEKIRNAVHGIVLRTTLIAGFPGETEEQFEELSGFVKNVRFERLGCFGYSAEEGTPAMEFDCAVESGEIERRADIITEQQLYILDEWCETKVGESLKVLVEGYDRLAECWFGRSYADAPDIDCKVFFTADKKPVIGDFVDVTIDDTMDGDLVGAAVNKK